MELVFQKEILNAPKFHTKLQAQSYGDAYVYFVQDSTLRVIFNRELTQQEQDDCSAFVVAFIDYETVDQLADYLDNEVTPFVKQLLTKFAAGNIAMGITQAGKTADVLGLFEKRVEIGASELVSLKAALDTGSLYVALSVLQYYRDNIANYSALSPYITDTRLLEMKNKIEQFLGIALST